MRERERERGESEARLHLVLEDGIEGVVVGPRGRLPPGQHASQQHQPLRPLALLQQGAQEEGVQGGVGPLAGPHEKREDAFGQRRLGKGG